MNITTLQHRHDPKRPTASCKFRRNRGTATMETVLVIPFILVFLLTIFLITKYQTRNQSAAVMTRYAAWQKATLAPPPYVFSTLVADQGQNITQGNANPQMNQMFFGDNATNIFMDYEEFERFDEWKTNFRIAAMSQASDSQKTYQYLVNYLGNENSGIAGYVGAGANAHMLIRHRDTQPQSTIYHSHTRIGDDWTYAANWAYRNPDRGTPTLSVIEYRRPYHEQLYFQDFNIRRYPADNSNAIRTTFYPQFDDQMNRYRNSGNRVARTMVNMYAGHTYYHGPDIPAY